MPLSSAERRRRRAFQEGFLRRLGGPQPLREMFDHLPDVSFCVKDRESRVVLASRAILEKFGMKDELEIVGTTDRDRYPAGLAEPFLAGDREVVASGKAVLDRAEVWYNSVGALDWCLTSKLPLRDPRGRVVGVMMSMRPWRGSPRLLPPASGAGRAVERIRREPGACPPVSELAREAGVSARQLQRRFLELFGVGVKEFALRARIQRAAELLRGGDAPLSRIALDAGFCDQSAFTRQFRRRTGLTPARYRRRWSRDILSGPSGGAKP
jgi:PAS domain S-box-containing protein